MTENITDAEKQMTQKKRIPVLEKKLFLNNLENLSIMHKYSYDLFSTCIPMIANNTMKLIRTLYFNKISGSCRKLHSMPFFSKHMKIGDNLLGFLALSYDLPSSDKELSLLLTLIST